MSASSKLRILHVIPGLAPRYGGPSRAVFEMCRALRDQGTETLIVSTDADGPDRLPVELNRCVLLQGVPVVLFDRQWSEAFKYSRPLSVWLRKNVDRFDLVHIHAVFSHSSLAAAMACRQSNVPYVVRPLGTLDPWALTQRRLAKNVLWRLGVERMLRDAAALHYTTHREKVLVERSLKLGHGVVIPLGVDAEVMQNGRELGDFREAHPELRNKKYVLALTRLHPIKCLDLLIECFLRVTSDSYRDWVLVVAGDGAAAYREQLKLLVRRLKGKGRVLFTGWLSGPQKLSAIRSACLLAMPSKRESFGLSVVEAMAAKVPVLVSDGVYLAEEIRESGAGWVVGSNHNGLIAGIRKALSDPRERSKRGEAGHRLVARRFRWEAVARQLLGLYLNITERGRSSRPSEQSNHSRLDL